MTGPDTEKGRGYLEPHSAAGAASCSFHDICLLEDFRFHTVYGVAADTVVAAVWR